MKYFSEMLLGLEPCTGSNIDQRQSAGRQQKFGERKPLGCEMKMRRATRCFLERTREVRGAHVEQSGEVLDLNVLSNVIADESIDRRQLSLGERCFPVAREPFVVVATRNMQCNYIGESFEAAQVQAPC
jgi:hypothetical protein